MLYGPWLVLKLMIDWSYLQLVTAVAVTVLTLSTTFTTEQYSRPYKAKSKRPIWTRMALEYCGLLKSWIKIPLQWLEKWIGGLKVTRKRKRFKRPKGRSISYRHRRIISWTRRAGNSHNIIRLCAFTAVLAMASADSVGPSISIRLDTDSRPLRVDNCASKSISNCTDDFVGPLVDVNRKIKGIGGLADGLKMGTIKWKIEDDDGKVHDILLPGSYYVPSAPSRLLSPQHWAQVAKDRKPKPRGTWCATYDDEIVLYWNQRKYKRTIKLDPSGDNVATMHTAPGYSHFMAFCAECGAEDSDDNDPLAYDVHIIPPDDEEEEASEPMADDTDEEEGINAITANEILREAGLLTDFDLNGPKDLQPQPAVVEDDDEDQRLTPTAEFLRWHHRLGHISPSKIQILAKQGHLPRRLLDCQVPMCTSCLYGKATRRPWRSRIPKNRMDNTPVITRPGDCVSVDQLVSTTPGLIAQLRGRPTQKRYRAATVFVDQYSGLGYVHLQKSTSAEETVEAKKAFERYAEQHGATVKRYHADNGIFADNLWRQECAANRQELTFCGVNAHFQNGVAERRIRELQDLARTMMIHANRRWPSAITTNLWPYAIRMANDLHNSAPSLNRKDNKSPLEIFTGTPVAPNPMHWQHFGCPVYVLDNAMQAGKKLRKWVERSRIGIYLGPSAQHARTVGLVLSMQTGLVSPQFHVKYDTTFQTVRKMMGGAPVTSNWQRQCGFTHQPPRQELFQQFNQPVIPETEGAAQEPQQQQQQPMGAPPQGDPTDVPSEEPTETPAVGPTEGAPLGTVYEDGLRRSTRKRTPSRKVLENLEAFEAALEEVEPSYVAFEVLADREAYAETNHHPLLAFAASADPDTMYLHEAMKEPDKDQFLKAMEKEVGAHTGGGHWTLLERSKVPRGTKVLPAVWSMKRKRRIATREIYKWKARLNIDGSKQVQGINYWETYAPVASWAAIRTVLTLSLLEQWETRQIDFVLAYTQADVECDMYMKIPKGFQVVLEDGKPQLKLADPGCKASQDEYVLRLNKNLYGQKQAGRVWNQHLVQKLCQECGFEQSKADECVFYRGKSIFVLYTDDSILTGPDPDELDQIINDMKAVALDITVDGDISDFLGVKIEREPNGTFNLTQPQLIDQILKDLRLDQQNVNPKDTPAAVSKPLFRFPNSPDFDNSFDYRRVVGRLNYLEKSTRPDISYATHQCARFAANPKQEHGEALRWLGRYLAGTRDKGIIYSPDHEQSFDVYADADFSGNWDRETAMEDPETAKSRSGYVISYANCPLLWASKLQTEVTLSVTESEFVSLSTALREVIPLMRLLEEMQQRGHNIKSLQPKVHCRAFEDNSGCIQLATVPKMRPRTKHINVKYHHFREHVARGDITVHKIHTDLQRADCLTHACNLEKLRRHRLAIMGW